MDVWSHIFRGFGQRGRILGMHNHLPSYSIMSNDRATRTDHTAGFYDPMPPCRIATNGRTACTVGT
jgi:hypothetical protein